LLFAINVRNLGAAWEVGKKGEDAMYYGVLLLDCFSLARLQLLLTIIVWESGVVGEGS
jgi:hypothetical protein